MSAAIDITPTPYDELAGINWSLLRNMRRSPLHYHYAETHQRPDSDTFRRGRLVHTLVLEPSRFEHDYAVFSGRRAGKIWEAFKAENAGRTIVKPAMVEAAQAMAAAVLAVWTPDEQREVTLTWTDQATGLRCKGRMDAVSPTHVTELKTTRSVAADFMSRQMHGLDYNCQLAHYRNGVRALTGRDVACRIVAVEAEPPHDAAVFEVDEEAMIGGEIEVAKFLALVVEHRASGVWPGRYAGPQVLSLPGWATNESDNDLTEIGLDFGADEKEGDES